MDLKLLASKLQGEITSNIAINNNISIDSRTIEPGQLFFAIKGENFDGNNFTQQAFAKGAVAAVVSEKTASDKPQLIVADTTKALGDFAAWWQSQFDIIKVAITGSCGKTSTKEMLASIFSEQGKTLATKGNFNNHIGMPLNLLQLDATYKYAVLEMGASKLGDINYLSTLANPQIATITNAAAAHLQGLGSVAGVAKEKSNIFNGLMADGIKVLNKDDPQVAVWQQTRPELKTIYFGYNSNDVQVSAKNIDDSELGIINFDLIIADNIKRATLHANGRHNVTNALAAAACAYAAGIGIDAIVDGLTKFSPVARRMAMHHTGSGAVVIDDSYNANPFSMQAALSFLENQPGKKVLVMADMGELGNDAAKMHQQIGVLAKQKGIDEVYAVGELTRQVVAAFGNGAYHFENKQQLIDTLRPLIEPATTLLIKGSNSAKMKDVVDGILK